MNIQIYSSPEMWLEIWETFYSNSHEDLSRGYHSESLGWFIFLLVTPTINIIFDISTKTIFIWNKQTPEYVH